MLLESNFVEDERVKKECIILSNNGFDVHVIYPNFKNQKFSSDTFEYYHVYKHVFQVNKTVFNKMQGTSLVLPFYFNFWEKQVNKILNTIKCFEVIYVHDLPLSKVGIRIKNKFKVKLICDQHEFYSDWIVRAKHMNSLIGKMILQLSNWVEYEKNSLKSADLVVSVTPELCQKYNVSIDSLKDKIVSLPNTPMKKFYLDKTLYDESIIDRYKSNYLDRIIYVGANLTFERGLDLMIDSIRQIVKVIPSFRFMVLGRPHSSYDIVKHIKEKGVEQYVEMIGFVPNNLIPTYLKCASIGANLHHPYSEEINNTIPTKIYQYLALDLAILTSDCKLISNMITLNKIGEIFEYTTEDLAFKVISLLQNKEYLKLCKINSNKINDMFWENTSIEWVEKIKGLI